MDRNILSGVEVFETRELTNMKIQMMKAALAASVLTLGMTAVSAQAATATADARATILSPVVVTKTSDLEFGVIANGTSGGTVTVSTAGARTCGAGLVCSGAVTAAGFGVVGVTAQTVGISVPANVTLNGGGSSMTATLSASDATIVLDGTDAFTVGGVLTVGAAQASGAYTGTFTVTVNYQ